MVQLGLYAAFLVWLLACTRACFVAVMYAITAALIATWWQRRRRKDLMEATPDTKDIIS